jgi:hypothetical protein
MNYKSLAAAIFLCAALANIPTLASAEQVTSSSPAQFQPHKESTAVSSSEATRTPAAQDDSVKLNMSDTLWIISFAVAGLVLLRKAQSE